MKIKTLLLVAMLLPFSCSNAGADTEKNDVNIGKVLEATVSTNAFQALMTIRPNPELIKFLNANGWLVDPNEMLIMKKGSEGKGVITPEMLVKANYGLDMDGFIVSLKTGVKLENSDLLRILAGLIDFCAVQKLNPVFVGAELQKWGIPQAFDGNHLVNPDGTATYYGLMFYYGASKKPEALKSLSQERLATSMRLFTAAYDEAFRNSSPDSAHAMLSRAWDMLSLETKEGETPVSLNPYNIRQDLAGYKSKALEFSSYRSGMQKAVSMEGKWGNPAERKEMEKFLIESLNQIEREKYHKRLDLSFVPGISPKPNPEVNPPFLTRNMPKLLNLLDKINGEPLSSGQVETLIKALPFGETILRMGAQELWRQGLTGKNVKIGVVDTGVGIHYQLDDAVKTRKNFSHQNAAGIIGEHGTHVAGTIHALAPDAEIHSYKALEEDHLVDGAKIMDPSEVHAAVEKAVDEAVKDGCRVINMSLGAIGGNPGNTLGRKIEEYSKKGVIFLISAGNADRSGVGNPSNAPSAITIGALDENNRVAVFSSYGSAFDRNSLQYSIKTVFMAPGTNIISTFPFYKDPAVSRGLGTGLDYQPMAGTSMAAPHATGVTTLLTQGAESLGLPVNPVETAAKASTAIIDAVRSTAKTMSRNVIPGAVPLDQDFIIIDAVSAWKKMQMSRNVAEKPEPAVEKARSEDKKFNKQKTAA